MLKQSLMAWIQALWRKDGMVAESSDFGVKETRVGILVKLPNSVGIGNLLNLFELHFSHL